MTPEQELLLRFASPPKPDPEAGIAALLAGDMINWPAFVKLSAREGLISIVYRQLWTLFSNRIPTEILERLRNIHFANSAMNLFLIRELETVLSLMKSRDIQVIPFKGPALAAQLYGDANLRTSSDIDLLVQRHDVRKAEEGLRDAGYHPEFPLRGAQGIAYLHAYNELTMIRGNRAPLEIQWGLVPWHYGFRWDLSDAFNRACSVKAGGAVFPTLPPEELLLTLCIHGTKHLWERLLWVCDVAWLVTSEKDLDWERTLSIASAAGGRRMLLLGLCLARDLFWAVLPDKVHWLMQSEPGLSQLAGEVKRGLFEEGAKPATLRQKMMFFLRARERRKDRVMFVVKTLLNVFLVARKPIDMPRLFLPLYFIMRPFSLASNYGTPILAKYAGRSIT
jgi:hypothetical protein